MPKAEQGRKSPTKVDDVENSSLSTLANRCQELSIITCTNTDDGFEGGSIVLDEFNTVFLLLPQFQVSIQ